MNISAEEAAQALREIEDSKVAMRRAIRNHRGHIHLWMWGAIWIIMSTLGWSGYAQKHPLSLTWVTLVGCAIALAIGLSQGRQIRATMDRRFMGICAALLIFSYFVWPSLLGGYRMSFEAMYAYFSIVWMQLYVVGGIMFSKPLLAVGIIVTALLMTGLLLVPSLFWAAAVLCGATLVGGGFVVRYMWS